MRIPKLLCIWVLMLLGSVCTYAAVFTVTSINNSGPGTLRDALEQAAANGTTETDYIYFNIPARARSLTILVPFSQALPDLSSNLVIDGTSQPSPNLGASSAKITVTFEGVYTGTAPLILFNLPVVRDISIYGLYIRANVTDRNLAQPDKMYGIHLQNAQNIIIGAPGKGNVISGWTHAVFDDYDARFGKSGLITLQGNLFGVETDGISTQYSGRVAGPTANRYSYNAPHNAYATIGGLLPEEGNSFNSSITDIFIQGEVVPPGSDKKVDIINNKFGVDVNGEMLNQASGIAIWVRRMSLWPAVSQPSPYIASNYIAGKSRQVGIFVDSTIYTNFTVEKNTIGGESNGAPFRDAYMGTGILLNDCIIGTIGGATTSNGNVIRYCKQGAIIEDRTSNILISHNSTYCNRRRAIELRNWTNLNPPPFRPQPFVTINNINSRTRVIQGTTKPNSTVELFYDDDCDGCEGKTYFAIVTADASGNWTYGGALNDDHIVATGTDPGGATSEYSRPEIDTSGLLINGTACGLSTGSICGFKIKSGTTWHWENEKGDNIGIDTCLFNVPAGKYYFKLSIGTGTCEEAFSFTVPDYTPVIDSASVIITHGRCGLPNGSVCGMKIINGQTWQWEDDRGNIVGTQVCLKDVAAGRYRLRVSAAGCTITSSFYEVKNYTPSVDASNVSVKNTTCNKNNGSITGIKIVDGLYAGVQWKDDMGNIIGTGYDLYNLAPGRYKIVVKDNAGYCGDTSNYFTIAATPPAALNITGVQIINTSCLQSNGSITNITIDNATAPIQYWWMDESGKVVAQSKDLINIKTGRYRLKCKDAGPCDTLLTPYFDVTNVGSVVIDTSGVSIRAVGCTSNNGSISGIRVTGADRYEWINTTNNTVVSASLTLTNMPPGFYQLKAYNNTYNCIAATRIYEIPKAVFAAVAVTQFTKQDASCNNSNGSINVQSLSNQFTYKFRWLKDSITAIGNGSFSINQLSPAVYYLVATDTNGCEQSIFRQPIVMLPLPLMQESNASVSADTCSFKTGSIKNITVTSDVAVSYKWYSNNTVVSTGKNLLNAISGTYYLEATDGRGCVVTSQSYIIPDAIAVLPTPQYNSQTIVRYSNATIRVNNPYKQAVTYQLFDSPTSTAPINQNSTGVFIINNVKEDRELFIKIIAGDCASAPGSVSIKVVDETIVEIPNAFSPNGDGINDEFRIQVTGLIFVNSLKIFNRWGQVVWETKEITNNWKGTRNGEPLPVGTYYYMLDAIGAFNKKIYKYGSVTIIR